MHLIIWSVMHGGMRDLTDDFRPGTYLEINNYGRGDHRKKKHTKYVYSRYHDLKVHTVVFNIVKKIIIQLDASWTLFIRPRVDNTCPSV